MKLLRHLAGYLPVNIASGIAAFGGVYVFTRLLGPDTPRAPAPVRPVADDSSVPIPEPTPRKETRDASG